MAVIAVAIITTLTAAEGRAIFSFVEQDNIHRVPVVISADNLYVTWWTDTGTPNSNAEIIFRASTDGGQSFRDKINLSNTSDIDSVD